MSRLTPPTSLRGRNSFPEGQTAGTRQPGSVPGPWPRGAGTLLRGNLAPSRSFAKDHVLLIMTPQVHDTVHLIGEETVAQGK